MGHVWFITETSSGFGQQLALAALSRGDKVIATPRNVSTLKSLEDAGANVMQLLCDVPTTRAAKTSWELPKLSMAPSTFSIMQDTYKMGVLRR